MAPAGARPATVSRRTFGQRLIGAMWLGGAARAEPHDVPILVYHRAGAAVTDAMTVRTSTLDMHLGVIERLRCTVIRLGDWVAWRRGERTTPLPPRAVAITCDDGHRSQFELIAPRLTSRGWPFTLFIYPSAISNASYAMTWQQVAALATDSGVSVQSHTYWHPNFARERRRLPPDAFTALATDQLRRSRDVIETRLSRPVSSVAWPFGIHDAELDALAGACGYRAAFALGHHPATIDSPLMAVPRYLMTDGVSAGQLAAWLGADRSQPPA